MNDDNKKILRLFLLRHARAGWAEPGQRDFDRSLDKTGLIEAEQVGNLAAANFDLPLQALCSTARRCRQTAEIFLSCQAEKPEIAYSDILFSGHIDDYLSEIKKHSASGALLLIGHNPMIEYVLTVFLGENEAKLAIPNGYPTSGLAVIDIRGDLTPGTGKLVAMLSP